MNEFYNVSGKIIVVILLIFVIFFAISNSYALQNINKLTYVVALGIDVGDNNNIKLSIQIAKPSSIDKSSSSNQSSASVVDSVECSNIESGINLFNSYISRSVNLSHCKMIVISEELAARDISEYLYDLSNNVEVSTHANIIISKCNAESFLKLANDTLENFPARYYQIVDTSKNSTGYVKGDTLIDFFSNYTDTFKEPIAVLSNINNYKNYSDKTSRKFYK